MWVWVGVCGWMCVCTHGVVMRVHMGAHVSCAVCGCGCGCAHTSVCNHVRARSGALVCVCVCVCVCVSTSTQPPLPSASTQPPLPSVPKSTDTDLSVQVFCQRTHLRLCQKWVQIGLARLGVVCVSVCVCMCLCMCVCGLLTGDDVARLAISQRVRILNHMTSFFRNSNLGPIFEKPSRHLRRFSCGGVYQHHV